MLTRGNKDNVDKYYIRIRLTKVFSFSPVEL